MSKEERICTLCEELAAKVHGEAKCKDGVCGIEVDRDLDVTILGRRTQSVLNIELSFERLDDHGRALSLVEIPLLEREVNPVVSILTGRGLKITAAHNHWLFEQPSLIYVHLVAIARPEDVVGALIAAFAALGVKL